MRGDFQMVCHRFDGQIKVYPIADVHFGALSHMEAEWERFVSALAQDESAYVILNGDLINNNTRSAVGSPWDDTVRPREQKRQMVEYLKPIRDRILCITSGNHERRSAKDADDDPTYDIAAKLDLEDLYRPDAAFVKIGLGSRGVNDTQKRKPQATYCFAVTHGAGGGIYTGATVNRNERWGNVIDGIDGLIVGHTHKGTVTRPAKLVVDPQNSRVRVQEYVVISCVAWQNYSGYPLQKMLLPSVAARPQVIYLDDKAKNIEVRW